MLAAIATPFRRACGGPRPRPECSEPAPGPVGADSSGHPAMPTDRRIAGDAAMPTPGQASTGPIGTRTMPSISTRALRLITARVTCHWPSAQAASAPTRNAPEG